MNFLTKPFETVDEKMNTLNEISSVLTILAYILTGLAYQFQLSKAWYFLIAPLLITNISIQISCIRLAKNYANELSKAPKSYYWMFSRRLLMNLILILFAASDLGVIELFRN